MTIGAIALKRPLQALRFLPITRFQCLELPIPVNLARSVPGHAVAPRQR